MAEKRAGNVRRGRNTGSGYIRASLIATGAWEQEGSF